MADKESPTIEEGAKETVDDAKMLMEELKKLDIQTPQDIQNMAYASRETGKAWNEVGELRQEVERLKASTNKPVQEDYYGNESVDLGRVVEEKVQGVLNRYLEGQNKAQMASMQMMASVRSDPEYAIVGKVFEEYINSPDAMMRLQSGQADYKTEYLNTKAAYYRNLAKRSSKTLEGLMEKKTKPPHVEQSDSLSEPRLNVDDEKVEQFNRIKKAQREGSIDSNQALDDIVKSVMPDIDKDPGFFTP